MSRMLQIEIIHHKYIDESKSLANKFLEKLSPYQDPKVEFKGTLENQYPDKHFFNAFIITYYKNQTP